MPTNPTPASVFDEHLNAWRAWQEAPWGRLRYAVVAHVLSRHLPSLGPRLRVLDVGGGDGTESVALARHGHQVVLVDYSSKMLEVAMAAAATAGVPDRLTTVNAGMEDLDALDLGEFDAVLCHFVVQYVDDPHVAVAALARRVRPGGLLSLVAPNPASEVLAAVVRGLDLARAESLLTATTVSAVTFDHQVARIEPEAAEEMVADAGLELAQRYGGRMLMDLVADDAVKHEPATYARLEALEIALCATPPYRDIGRFWQLVAYRPASAV